MTDIDITPETVDYALGRWERVRGALHPTGRAVGDELAALLRALPALEPVLPPETYTSRGLPRRAASRAREHGATINYSTAGIVVEFPNGSRLTVRGALLRDPIIQRTPGAAPGCTVPDGGTLEEILNNYADEREGRS
jgi:hypothetical protein